MNKSNKNMNKSNKKWLIKKPITLNINHNIPILKNNNDTYHGFILISHHCIYNNINNSSNNNINKFLKYTTNKTNKVNINLTKIYNKTIFLEKNISKIDDFIIKKYKVNILNNILIYNKNNINISIIVIDYKSKINFNGYTFFDLLRFNNDDILNKNIYKNILKHNINNQIKEKNIYLYNKIFIENDVYNGYILIKSIYRHIVGHI